VTGDPENPDVYYEKHKIFLYREDLSKFTEALIDVIRFMQDNDSPELPSELDSTAELSNALTESDLSDFTDHEPAIKLNLGDFENV